MPYSFSNLLAAALYLGLSAFVFKRLLRKEAFSGQIFTTGIILALVSHLFGLAALSIKPNGFELSFFAASSQIFWVINLIVFISSRKKALDSLFIFLLPFSCVSVLLAAFAHDQSRIVQLNYAIASHVVLSILAYSLLTIATLQALFLAYRSRQLKHKQLHAVSIFPPLQTIESLLFEFVIAGEIILTLSIVSGAFFMDNLFAQHLVHKTVFSIAAWSVYAALLFGKFRLGWRGNTAIRWALAGFLFLMLAYFGSKFVLEVVLHRV